MDVFAQFYPDLSDRAMLPLYYLPGCFAISLLPFLVDNKPLAAMCSFPLLLYICICWPKFTTGDPSSDYFNSTIFIATPLWYIDFVLLTPRDGENGPIFLSKSPLLTEGQRSESLFVARGQQWKQLETFSERLGWAFRLMLPPHRGIGWNWQVKNVPADPHAQVPKLSFVLTQILSLTTCYVRSVAAMATLGFAYDLKAHDETSNIVQKAVAVTLIGWAGALWIWDRMNCAYSFAAVLAVATRLTDTWEWPPLMGPLKEAWSVRQMWSVTYHQVCRRLLSQPSRHIVRLLNLRKGSLASSYSQLFLTFGISCLFHQAQMFNVRRKDMGELLFFIAQPLAIVAEDIVQWTWRKAEHDERSRYVGAIVGYTWTFLWFSLSLHFYISGLVEAEIVRDWFLGYQPIQVGFRIASRWA